MLIVVNKNCNKCRYFYIYITAKWNTPSLLQYVGYILQLLIKFQTFLVESVKFCKNFISTSIQGLQYYFYAASYLKDLEYVQVSTLFLCCFAINFEINKIENSIGIP
jgi:hypothetical protein